MSENKKIFQPKVIIGSILGFVSAAVGTVAVFFPSLLNMEQEKMPKYYDKEGGDELEDYNGFIKFLDDRIKDEKLFEVRFHLPLGEALVGSAHMYEELFKKGIAFSEDDKYVCIIVTSGRKDAATGANTGGVEGFGVEFSEIGESVSDLRQLEVVDLSEFCFPGELTDWPDRYEYILNGYAHYDGYFSSNGNYTYKFKAVDKSAVKLKKY